MSSFPYMRIIVPVVGVFVILALGAYISLTLKEARYLNSGPTTISVNGTGETFATPDIATFNFSVVSEADDAVSAQDMSAKAVNEIVAYLEDQGIEEKDIKTRYYNLNPRYEYVQQAQALCVVGQECPPPSPGQRVLRGYEVNQTIEVKVRETSKAGELISGVGSRGATNVSGLQFTIDDEEAIKSEAREKAIADAKEKAHKLANDLGVKIVRMAGYYENQGPYPIYGMGGAEAAYDSAAPRAANVAPSVPTGENSFTVTVTVTYEVR